MYTLRCKSCGAEKRVPYPDKWEVLLKYHICECNGSTYIIGFRFPWPWNFWRYPEAGVVAVHEEPVETYECDAFCWNCFRRGILKIPHGVKLVSHPCPHCETCSLKPGAILSPQTTLTPFTTEERDFN